MQEVILILLKDLKHDLDKMKKTILFFACFMAFLNLSYADEWLSNQTYNRYVEVSTWNNYEVIPPEYHNIHINTIQMVNWYMNVYDSWTLIWSQIYEGIIVVKDKMVLTWQWEFYIQFSIVPDSYDPWRNIIFSADFLRSYYELKGIITVIIFFLVFIFKLIFLWRKSIT